ncbi:MAG: peptidylprolyl isomerase [Paracoccus sp. (in: a-proteobacteria)]|uniref:peptidylprolyl isomerase n=1 Tax=Paracoccus sp. TaxID=267 RepID=UPI0026E0CA4D|nr:peptidylprolyl isomerase [Paracoccus sp. (in: a-proteobacteria)]MDO5611685.1 peptidylprolyl isomerase [Paracoccus sp. (in: a-proteobacteria)]
MRLFRLSAALAVTTAVTTMLAAPAIAQDADTVVATVNDTPITLGQMIAMKQGLHDQAAANLPDQALWDLMLDQLIRTTAVAQLGESGMTARDKARLELERRAYLASAALEKVAGVEIGDADITAAYQSMFGEAAPMTQYSAAHILVETEAEAQDIRRQLADGADFGQLARERSQDPASGANDGELGWFSADQMVAPFAEAVKSLQKDQISDPVQSDFGWHVIRLDDTRLAEAPKLDQIRPQLVAQLRREKVDAEVQRIVSEAAVDRTEGLTPSLINNTEFLDVK